MVLSSAALEWEEPPYRIVLKIVRSNEGPILKLDERA